MTPDFIGRYRIEGELGRGAAGTAYRAHDPETGRPVAVKLLSVQMARDETMQRRFVREMSVLSKLNNDNIVRYLDGGIYDDRFYYAMELVDSGTLKDVLVARGQIPWRDAVECAIQVASALGHAHEAGIVHRDLKPGNLFLADNGLIKLGDFGLARDLAGSTLTAAGMTVGTCLYMSPEQIEGRRDITPAADVYALGCLLFELTTGRVPFVGDSVMEVLKKHHDATPPDLADFVPSAPKELGELIQKLLAKRPEDRPASAAQVRDELQGILQRHVDPTDASAVEIVPNLATRLRTAPPSTTRQLSWKSLTALAVVVLIGVILAALANN